MRGHWGWLASISMGALAAGTAFADETKAPAPVAAPAASDDKTKIASPTEVTVTAKKGDVSDRIDRRVYNIKDDPDSQTGIVADVLNKLPSVTVTPTGKVALRGDTNVTVLVDGKYPINGNSVTQTLSAADVDRIEIMTNPSAQYAPDGTSGVINIITRKRHPFGLSGNANMRINTLGQSGADGSATLTTGPWSITGQFHTNRWSSRYSQSGHREYPDTSDLFGVGRSEGAALGGEADIAYKLGDNQTLTLDLAHTGVWYRNADESSYRSAAQNYDLSSHSTNQNTSAYVEAIYEYNNDKTGSHFTLDTWHFDFNNSNIQAFDQGYMAPGAGVALYGNRAQYAQPEDDIKGDYERHFTSGNELTAGFEWNHHTNSNTVLYNDSGTVAGPYADGFARAFKGDRTLLSGYVTYQMPLVAGWVMLPGIRIESEDIHILPQSGPVTAGATRFYPSLHLTHDLTKGKLKLSYSRRVMRPDITQYDPTIIYWGSLFASQGNPNLKPPETDSYELGYDYTKADISYDATLYYRATQNNLTTVSSDIGKGVILSRNINSGHSRSGGVELTEKHPLTKTLKYSVNANLYYIELDRIDNAPRSAQGQFTYSGNAMLEYDAKNGDQLQTNLAVTGKQPDVQGYTKATSHVDVTWRHPLTKKVSLVVVASDLFRGMAQTTVINTPDLKSVSYRAANDQSLRVALSYKFGPGTK